MSNQVCKFCGAMAKDGWSDRESSICWFKCGTMYKNGDPDRADQTRGCSGVERISKDARIEALSAHVKRLEEAGDKMGEHFCKKVGCRPWTVVDWCKAKEAKP